MYVCLYVDDMLFTQVVIRRCSKNSKERWMENFEMINLGLMTYYLGKSSKVMKRYFLSQKTYAEAILKEFKMNVINSVATSMECGAKLSTLQR